MPLALTSSKHAATVAAVARRLLAVEVGDQIPTVAELSAEAQAGSGTVQAALRALRDAGVVELSSHGHLGTKLVARDLPDLWTAAGLGPVEGVLPLPTSLEFAGLATALVDRFEAGGLPISLSFRQGALSRLESLQRGRRDFVACSAPTARQLAGADHAVVLLPPDTFYGPESVVVITRAGERPRPRGVVPFDPQSRDHTTLTQAEFPEADLRPAPYIQVPELVVRGEVDAAVWHQTNASPLLVARGLDVHPLSRPLPPDAREISRAALVLRDDDPGRDAAVRSLLDPHALAAVQREVIERRRVPAF